MTCPGARRSLLVVLLAIIVLPVISFVHVQGDGGYIPMMNINVYEPGQNAIICWNGEQERMYLSINIYADEPTEGIHFVPFPSLPRVSLGDFETFENMERVFLRELDFHSFDNYNSDGTSGGGGGEEKSFEVKFTATLGSHSITVIEVVDPEDFKDQINELMEQVGSTIEAWPTGLEDVIVGYCNKGYSYFAIDRFQIGNEPGSVEPLIYDFKSRELVFPLEISSILKGQTSVKLALITSEDHPIDISGVIGKYGKKGEGILSLSDVLEVDPSLDKLFDGRCIGQYFEMRLNLPDLKGDFIISTLPGVSWCMAGKATAEYSSHNGLGQSQLLVYERTFYPDEDGIRLVDETNGEVLWEVGPMREMAAIYDHKFTRNAIFDDLNGLGGPEVILIDSTYNRTCYETYVTRLDPVDGLTLWSRKVPNRSYSGGYLHLTGYDQTLLVLYSTSDILVISLQTGSFWNSSSYSNVLGSASLSAVSTKEADMVLLENTKYRMTSVIDPWKDPIETLWSVPENVYTTVHFGAEDLLLFKDNDLYRFRECLNGSIVNSYRTGNNMIGCYVDEAAPGWLYGITLTYDYPNLVVDKVSISHKNINWTSSIGPGIGTPAGMDQYSCTYTDINSDGVCEIVVYIPSTTNPYVAGYVPSKLSTFVLDGVNGSLLFNSPGKLMGIMDGTPSRAPQICLNEMYHISIHNLRSGDRLVSAEKHFPLSGEVLRSMRDINDDGFTDIITTTYNRSYYDYYYSIKHGDAFINGYTQKCERFVEIDTSTAYQFGSILSGADGRILYREGYRLYSRAVESRLMMQADSDEVYIDGTLRFFLKAGDGAIPADIEDIELSSSLAMGMFVNLKQLLPGLYSFEWKAPQTYTGEVTIKARVLVEGVPVSEAKTTVIVKKRTDVNEDISMLSSQASISARSVNINEPVLVEVDIGGQHDPLLLTLKLTDLSLCGMVSQPIMTLENRYVGSFIPVREVEIASLLLEVRYGEELVLRRLWAIEVLERVEIEHEKEDHLAIGDPQVFPRVLAPEGSSLIFIPFSGTDRHDDIRVICDDDGRGGSFSNLRILMGSLIVLDYHAPSTEGSVAITAVVYLEADPVGSVNTWLSVVEDPKVEPRSPTGLFVSYRTVRSGSIWQPTTDIFITVTRDEKLLESINYIQVNSIGGINVDQGTAYDDITLHLVAKHSVAVLGPIQILIWDEFGTSQIIDIYLNETPVSKEEGPVEEPGPQNENGENTDWYLPGAIIATLAMALVLIVISAALWDRMRNDGFAGPPERKK
ncbi:MAG: DUF2330 domain-containing protein [Thermoplasmatota archaeon]